jgi:tetratricopeptide (TPR) repeat protein
MSFWKIAVVSRVAGIERRPLRTAIGAALLLALTLIAYIPALKGGFIWDDDFLVTKNPNILTFEGLVRTWTEPRANKDFYPLTHTFFWLEHRFRGFDPFVFHLNNVLLHAGNGILFWLILRRLAVPGAWAAAAIFLVHPLHVESVAWISERKNVLSGFLCLLAVRSFLESAPAGPGERESRRWYSLGLSLVFYISALLAKPMTMAAAAVLPLLTWWKCGRLGRRDALAIAPYFVAAAPLAVLTIWIQYHHVGATGDQFGNSLPQRVILAGRVVWFYAGKLLWPQELTFAYAKWALRADLWWQYAYTVGAAAVFIALTLLRRRIGKGPVVAVAAFVILLSPALGLINIYWHRYYFVADHMPYLASMSLIALGAATAMQAAVRLGPRGRPAVLAAAVVVVGALGTLTWRQGGIYKDAETIWRDTLRKNPASSMANNNLGIILARRGETEEAVRLFRAALLVDGDNAAAHYNLGNALLGLGRMAEAVPPLREALRIKPDYAEAHYVLARALDALGQPVEAKPHFLRALRPAPD